MRTSLATLFLICGTLLTASTSLATAPEFLFHWTSRSGLQRIAQGMEQNRGQILLQALPDLEPGDEALVPVVSVYYPFIKNGTVLFAWTHPLGGMGRSSTEVYAGNLKSPETARLLALKIRTTARVAKLTSEVSPFPMWNPAPGLAPENVDLYEFEYWDKSQIKDRPLYSEWLIRNPEVIEFATAHPDQIRLIIEPERKRFSTNTPSFSSAEIYGGKTNDLYFTKKGLKWVNAVIDRLLETKSEDVPAHLLR